MTPYSGLRDLVPTSTRVPLALGVWKSRVGLTGGLRGSQPPTAVVAEPKPRVAAGMGASPAGYFRVYGWSGSDRGSVGEQDAVRQG